MTRFPRDLAGLFAIVFVVMQGAISADRSLAAEAPESVAQAIERLEAVLGRFDAKDARQFRVKFDREETQKPEEDQLAVLDKTNGLTIYGTPFQMADSASFDMVQQHNRTVYRLETNGDRTVIRRQQRFFLARFSIRPTELKTWEFQMAFLSHSIPRALGTTYLSGTVRWLDGGFQLNGLAMDEVYAASGELIPSFQQAEIRITRKGDVLEIKDSWQGFHQATGKDGAPIHAPNFEKPIGKPSPWLQGTSLKLGDS